MRTDNVMRWGRRGAFAAAPLAVVGVALAGVAEGSAAGMASPMGIAGGVAVLAGATSLLLALLWLHLRTRQTMDGRGSGAMAVAIAGGALTAGAAWSLAFVLPGLEGSFPGLLEEPLPSVVAGYILSHAILGLGILVWAVVARRAGAISKGVSTVLIVGGLICVTPLPARFVVVAIGLLLAARRAEGSEATVGSATRAEVAQAG